MRKITVWQLLLLLVFFGVLSIVLLRQNNLHMVQYRNLVKMADEQNDDVQTALQNLQQYVSHHMNTSMGDKGLYLEHTYQRAYDRAVQEALAQHTISNSLYQQADKDCQTQFSRTASFQAYIQCVTDKVGTLNPAQDPLQAIKAPPTDLFRYNFVPPLWSPDAAGWSIVITIVLAAVIIVRLAVRLIVYAVLHFRHVK